MTLSKEQGEKEIRLYELAFNLLPSLSEQEAAEAGEAIKTLLLKNEAVIKTALPPQMKPLSYSMEKRNSGKKDQYSTAYAGSVVFELPSETIVALTAEITALPTVLRSFIMGLPKEALLERERPLTITRERHDPKKGAEKPVTDAAPISEAELDKTIEDLVIQ